MGARRCIHCVTGKARLENSDQKQGTVYLRTKADIAVRLRVPLRRAVVLLKRDSARSNSVVLIIDTR